MAEHPCRKLLILDSSYDSSSNDSDSTDSDDDPVVDSHFKIRSRWEQVDDLQGQHWPDRARKLTLQPVSSITTDAQATNPMPYRKDYHYQVIHRESGLQELPGHSSELQGPVSSAMSPQRPHSEGVTQPIAPLAISSVPPKDQQRPVQARKLTLQPVPSITTEAVQATDTMPNRHYEVLHRESSAQERPRPSEDQVSHGQLVTQPTSPLDVLTVSSPKYALAKSMLPPAMVKFLAELRLYFVKEVNLERNRPPIAKTTYDKAEERLLCFLGFVHGHLPQNSITTDLFLRESLIEKYLTFLKEDRGLAPATISNHAAALIYPAKFMHGESSPHYNGVQVIRRLRAQVAFFQRKAYAERPSTKEDLEKANRWLDWPEILKAVDLQRHRMDMARSAPAKAAECSDLLLLTMYTLLPPARALEIRTLEVLPRHLSASSPILAKRNLVTLDEAGGVTLTFQNYKTVKTYGNDITKLKPNHDVSMILKEYLKNYRSKLTNAESGDFVFVTKTGKPFTSSSFSAHIKFVFNRVTGVKVSVNILRSSFLTHAYSLSTCTDTTKDSLATAMRHSRRHAQGTYDRRNANERKGMALDMASQIAAANEVNPSEQEGEGRFGLGDFVGLAEEDSTLSEPIVMIARIQCFLPERQASLLWYKKTSRPSHYSFEYQPEPWLESIDSLCPVNMKPVSKQPGHYKLYTSTKSIHKAICGKD